MRSDLGRGAELEKLREGLNQLDRPILLKGFAAFCLRRVLSRSGPSPRTGGAPFPSLKISFRPCRAFREALNSSDFSSAGLSPLGREVLLGISMLGSQVQLPGLGRFEAICSPARSVPHPLTGEVIEIPERLKPRFQAAPELLQRLEREHLC